MINPEAKRAARQRHRRMLANIERAQGARADWDRWTNPPEPSRSQRKRARDAQRKQRRADEAARQPIEDAGLAHIWATNDRNLWKCHELLRVAQTKSPVQEK